MAKKSKSFKQHIFKIIGQTISWAFIVGVLLYLVFLGIEACKTM